MSGSQKEISKIAKRDRGFNPSTRRSQLEIMMDILLVVEKGAQKPTQIMYRANLAWIALKSHLARLVEEGLLEKKPGNSRELVITEKGRKIVESFNAIVGQLRPQTVDFLIQPPSATGEDSPYTEIGERLDRLEESLEVMSDARMLRSVREGLRDLKAGRYKKYSSVEELAKTMP